jgi:hypothetical protein
MGHFAENNIYRKLGRKIDNLTIKVPWNKTLYSILTELYSTDKFMRGFIGGFLKLTPVKKALMSDMLRSTFLNSMKKGLMIQGRGWIAEL